MKIKIKKRNTIKLGLLMIIAILVLFTGYFFIEQVKASPDTWWDEDWEYRRNVTINNSANANNLTNYQVLINVSYDSDMDSTFKDLRFTWFNYTDGTETELNYWIEKNVSSNYAEVWVNVIEIQANSYQNIYMYYGNPSANSISNGVATFEFFDDFNMPTLNTTKWGSTGSGVSISNNRLRINNTVENSLVYSQNNFTITNYAFEYTFYAVNNGRYVHNGWTNTTEILQNSDKYIGFSQQHVGWLAWQWINESTINYGETQPINNGDVFNLRITFNGSTANWYINNSLYKTQDNLVMFPNAMRLNFQAAGYPSSTNIKEYDNMRVRKFASPEPTHFIGNEEKETIPPKYSDASTNTTLAGQTGEFRLKWTDNVGLSGYIFSWCNNETVGNVFEDFIGFTGGTINNACLPSNSYCLDASNGWKGYAEDFFTSYNPGNSWTLLRDDANGQSAPSVNASTRPNMAGMGELWTYKFFSINPNTPFNISFTMRCRRSLAFPWNGTIYLFNGNVTPCTSNRQTGLCSDSNGNTSNNIGSIKVSCGQSGSWGSWTSGIFIDNVTNNDTITVAFHIKDAWADEWLEYEVDNVSLTLAINEYWKNDTWNNTNWDSTNEWSNVTKTINSTIGALIRWKVYANDTSNNWNASETYSFITSESIPPKWSNQGSNATIITMGESVMLYVYLTDNFNLSHALLATDETGVWENKTSYGSPMLLSDASGWANFTWQNPGIGDRDVSWKIYFNDTSGNENVTNVMSFRVVIPKKMHAEGRAFNYYTGEKINGNVIVIPMGNIENKVNSTFSNGEWVIDFNVDPDVQYLTFIIDDDEKIGYTQIKLGVENPSTEKLNCTIQNISLSGYSVYANTGNPITSGKVRVSVQDTQYTNITSFSGTWNIDFHPCLISGKIYILYVLISDDTGKTGEIFQAYPAR